ncbi:MAG TPA: GntR family transcriptional regulator [Pedobacter sp.]|jgi:DNA-binding transcriptional regulator YhcF (GntR family)
MEFRDNEAIYLQIAGYVNENILLGKWPPETKIPSVRELAGELQVNPNTVMRSYELLQNLQIIQNKRGIGYFITIESLGRVKKYKKEKFIEAELPAFFRNLYLLDIDLDEITKRYKEFKSENFN